MLCSPVEIQHHFINSHFHPLPSSSSFTLSLFFQVIFWEQHVVSLYFSCALLTMSRPQPNRVRFSIIKLKWLQFKIQLIHIDNCIMALPSNSLKESAEHYLRKHRIIQLMEDLCSDLCFEQPQNINEFLIERLKLKQKQGFKIGIFSKEEISNIFVLFDLKREGFIDKERCKEALKTLANNEFQFQQVNLASLPDKVDEKGFVALCEKVLGAK